MSRRARIIGITLGVLVVTVVASKNFLNPTQELDPLLGQFVCTQDLPAGSKCRGGFALFACDCGLGTQCSQKGYGGSGSPDSLCNSQGDDCYCRPCKPDEVAIDGILGGPFCVDAFCGDGIVNGAEQCDNGEQFENGGSCTLTEAFSRTDCAPRNGDGCSSNCSLEGQQQHSSSTPTVTSSSRSSDCSGYASNCIEEVGDPASFMWALSREQNGRNKMDLYLKPFGAFMTYLKPHRMTVDLGIRDFRSFAFYNITEAGFAVTGPSGNPPNALFKLELWTEANEAQDEAMEDVAASPIAYFHMPQDPLDVTERTIENEPELIGSTGVSFQNAQLVYAHTFFTWPPAPPSHNGLYLIANNLLYRLNQETGAATLINSTPIPGTVTAAEYVMTGQMADFNQTCNDSIAVLDADADVWRLIQPQTGTIQKTIPVSYEIDHGTNMYQGTTTDITGPVGFTFPIARTYGRTNNVWSYQFSYDPVIVGNVSIPEYIEDFPQSYPMQYFDILNVAAHTKTEGDASGVDIRGAYFYRYGAGTITVRPGRSIQVGKYDACMSETCSDGASTQNAQCTPPTFPSSSSSSTSRSSSRSSSTSSSSSRSSSNSSGGPSSSSSRSSSSTPSSSSNPSTSRSSSSSSVVVSPGCNVNYPFCFAAGNPSPGCVNPQASTIQCAFNGGGNNGLCYRCQGDPPQSSSLSSGGGTPGGTNGGTPDGTNGGTPSGTNGGTPSGTNGGTPSGTNGGTPSGTNGGTPSGTNGGTPSGDDGGGGSSSSSSSSTPTIFCQLFPSMCTSSSSSGGPNSCQNNNDCPQGQVCIDDECVPQECNTDFDCPGSEVCSGGICIDDECDDDNDCPVNQICIDDSCVPQECEDDIECPGSQVCTEGVCTENECEEDDDCPVGFMCIDGECEIDECENSFDCPANQICLNGECEESGSSSSQTMIAQNSSDDDLPSSPWCGDGVRQGAEQCDDGNANNNDGCTNQCDLECSNNAQCPDGICLNGVCTDSDSSTGSQFCGNGFVNFGEECDDGNDIPNDGCSSSCTIDGRGCTSDLECSTGRCINGSCFPCVTNDECSIGSCENNMCQLPSLVAAASVCGNGVMESNEECDDTNSRDGDGCSAVCLLEIGICGDGKVQQLLGEQCETSLHDPSLPYTCTNCRFSSSTCGNGTVDPGEECDSGPANSNTPDSQCRTSCSRPRCGDGIKDSTEMCDDGNRIDNDGCNRICAGTMPTTQVAGGGPLQGFPIAFGNSVNINWPTGSQWPTQPTTQSITFQLPLAQLQSIQSRGPAGDTGPAAIMVVAAGAASGLAWARRKKGK